MGEWQEHVVGVAWEETRGYRNAACEKGGGPEEWVGTADQTMAMNIIKVFMARVLFLLTLIIAP